MRLYILHFYNSYGYPEEISVYAYSLDEALKLAKLSKSDLSYYDVKE